MDIKLKNKHRLGAAIATTAVLGAALIMVGLYPFFRKEASKQEVPVYEEYGFLRTMVRGNYVLNVEAMESQQGTRIPPFDIYFPMAGELAKSQEAGETWLADLFEGQEAEVTEEKEEVMEAQWDTIDRYSRAWEYSRGLKENFNGRYEGWKNDFYRLRRNIQYQVYSEDGTLILDRYEKGDLRTADGFAFKTVLHYDQNGKLEVADLKTENQEKIKPILEELGSDDPMERYYEDQFLYETGMTMEKPAGKTFVYAQTAEMAQQYREQVYNPRSGHVYSEIVIKVFMGLAAAVGVITLILSGLGLMPSEDSKLLKVPVELVAVAVTGATGIGISLIGLVAITNEGEVYNTLLSASFLPTVARIMAYLWNLMWWCVPFAVACWAAACAGSVLEIGFKRYFLERTLVGIIWNWIKRVFERCSRFLAEIDLQDKSNRVLWKIVGVNFLVLTVLCSLWFFGIVGLLVYSALLFIILRKYYTDLRVKYRVLLNATNQIAEGNLEVSVTENLGVFEPFKKEIQKIQSGFKLAVEEEVKSQNMKTDLITNVSHDLKTPLTAIITYINLLKEETITEEQRKSYIDVLETKSMRLKSLIEDLFEVSKATSKNVTLNLVEVDLASLLKEVRYEMNDKIEESSIDFRWNLPEEKVVVSLDSQKTYRIFENLLTNIIKYSMPHTRAFIDLKAEEDGVVVTMRNVSASELDFNPEDITDRFVRGDQSRNTEGSGLGLAIAKSFVELQKGKMTVEAEADLFRVIIRWPL